MYLWYNVSKLILGGQYMSISVTSEAYPYLAMIAIVIVLVFVITWNMNKSSQKKLEMRKSSRKN